MSFLDLNGTIIDDWGAVYAGARNIFKYCGKEFPSGSEHINTVARDLDYMSFYIDHRIDITRAELHELFVPAYQAHSGEVTVIDGVHEFLNTMLKFGVEIHIVTAAPRELAEPLIQNINISKFCDAIHYHIHDKSAQIHAVIDGMDIGAHECVMVGDLPSDIRFGQQCFVSSILMRNTHTTKVVEELAMEAGVDHIVNDFYDLQRVLEKKFSNVM